MSAPAGFYAVVACWEDGVAGVAWDFERNADDLTDLETVVDEALRIKLDCPVALTNVKAALGDLAEGVRQIVAEPPLFFDGYKATKFPSLSMRLAKDGTVYSVVVGAGRLKVAK